MGKAWDAPLKIWETGAQFSKPGIGDRNTPWPAFGAYGAANPTCAVCGGRARGARKCACAEPEWKPIGKRRGAPIKTAADTAPAISQVYQDWCEIWAAAAFRVLRRGGYLLAFGGTRTHHRLWCAIEDAGFVIQDSVLWLYGQGFPKGRTQLKPAWEPIVVAYRPGGKRSLQIDECRIGDFVNETPPGTDRYNQRNFELGYRPSAYQTNGRDGEASAERRYTEAGGTNFAAKPRRRIGSPQWGGPMKRLSAAPGQEGRIVERLPPDGGRWPANVCHDGSDEVMEAFAAFGDRKAGSPVAGDEPSKPFGGAVCYGGGLGREASQSYADNGSAVRFYFCAKADAEDRWGSKHPTVKPVELLKWLVPLFAPKGGLVIDTFAGSGTTGVAALATGRECVLIEREAEYIADIHERLAFYRGDGRHSLVSKNRNRREAVGSLL
jgi:site-specific DNA-methyltransferase (adenine-specific)